MKTIIFIAAILIGVTSCKKSSPTPVSPSTNNSVALNSVELLLVGNWSYDKQELLSNGTVVAGPSGTVYFNDSTVYHIEFTSTCTTGTYKKCIDGTSGSDHNIDWEASSNKLFIQNNTYSIENLTSTNLVYYTGSLITGAAIRYSFHKL